ncbi:lipoyl synthase [bacterium]|nr:lipoyl synthase [bacterium]
MSDLVTGRHALAARGIAVCQTNRGGQTTGHNPGQLVAYPVLSLRACGLDVERYLRRLEASVVQLLAEHGVSAHTIAGRTGVWVGEAKIASLGVRVRRGVVYHGVALNVENDLSLFDHFVMCGLPEAKPTRLCDLVSRRIELAQLERRWAEILIAMLNLQDCVEPGMLELDLPMQSQVAAGRRGYQGPKPRWIRAQLPGGDNYRELKGLMRGGGLHTVCESARCPNIGDCWERRTATFMLLGDTCTRACRFCAVPSGRPVGLDESEPVHVAEAAVRMGLQYVVLTSVNRDDLPDGGAHVFARTIHELRKHLPGCKIETLIPDFCGDWDALQEVIEAGPDVLNHNLETVPRLYPRIQPRCNYAVSLELLSRAKAAGMKTKSGLLVGIGERQDEIFSVLCDLADIGCDISTLGQYLRPTPQHAPVDRYLSLEEFEQLRCVGESLGIPQVFAGPMVRSSFHAEEVYAQRSLTG